MGPEGHGVMHYSYYAVDAAVFTPYQISTLVNNAVMRVAVGYDDDDV